MVFIQTLLTFLSSWKFVLAFYIVLAIIIYIHRKKFQLENGFILLYRTDFGIKFINKIADKYGEFIKVVGYSAIGIGFAGMIAICALLLKGLYELIFVPSAPPTLSLVIPGVQIPGSPIFVPFWYGVIALFIVVLVHEFGHGIIARANGLKIKNTGFGFMGPLPLAFVEPDEKEVVKKDSVVQHSIFAAGPFFNVILAAFVLLLLFFAFNPLVDPNNTLSVTSSIGMVEVSGFQFSQLDKGYPAETAGLKPNTVYDNIDGKKISNAQEFDSALRYLRPNQTITISNANESFTLVTASNPSDKTKGYIGIIGPGLSYELKNEAWWYNVIYYILSMFTILLGWVFTLSLGIGLANLLPLGPVDGGRMVGKALIDINGKKKGMKIWAAVTLVTIAIMLVLILVPIIKSVFFKV